ncbi:MAG: DUF692 family protein [Gammaproteobacteria bacterium]|nr:DUF692 family protein [Gammaproteobacteria bacterium]
MKIGVNWISPTSFPTIKKLIEEGEADFCEIMLDNFVHLSPEKICTKLPSARFAFHLVTSRFLEKDRAELAQLADKIKPWQDKLNPLYVSDHIVRFSDDEGRRLPLVGEYDYEQCAAHLLDKVALWQALLGKKIFFENHASLTHAGKNQAGFYQTLIQHTSAGLLYDFSNAYIAEQNNVAPVAAWQSLALKTNFFHVSGFQIHPETKLAIDTHDQPIATAVHQLIQNFFTPLNHQDKTLVLEFDADVSYETWVNEIKRIRTLFNGHNV